MTMATGIAAKAGTVLIAVVVAVLVELALDKPVFVEQACLGLGTAACHDWLLDGLAMRLAFVTVLPLSLGILAAVATRDWTTLLLAGTCAAIGVGFTIGAEDAHRAAYDESRDLVLGKLFIGGAIAAVPGLAASGAVWAG